MNKTNASKKCDIYHYWYFLDKIFDYKPYLCNGGYDIIQKTMNFNDISIVSDKGNDYRTNFLCMRKDE